MNVRFVFQLVLVTRKLIIEVFFKDCIDEEWGICIFNKIRFNAFYVIMKRVPVVADSKQPICQTIN